MLDTDAIIAFSKQVTWDDLPSKVRGQIKLCLLDLIGIAAGGSRTKLSKIVCGIW